MKKSTRKTVLGISCVAVIAAALYTWDAQKTPLQASSHREAPLIANDPLADNTDLYAFRSPDDTSKITIIANYVPLQLPQGGPNFASFGENIRYEIHIENNATSGDDITYRFMFSKINEDTTTFFNIRLGKQNLKTSYTVEKSVGGGPFAQILSNGIVPPPNIGPRSITGAAGLNTNYAALMNGAIANASGAGGEKIFCGPVEDPFFTDLGGIFDLGQTRGAGGKDGLGHKNVHSIALQIPISTLQQTGLSVSSATNILDSRFVIGVWASASRQTTRTLGVGVNPTNTGAWVQVSRIGMPLTNEAIMPIGAKDKWNSRTPYTEYGYQEDYFCNPELALYMDNSQFGSAVPALSALRVQSNSLQTYDFRNGKAGLSALASNPAATANTAFAPNLFGPYLLRPGKPRSVDILPIFHTGVPNLPPYQLATGKGGNPLAPGKPFINNFMPIFGDMLRLNMAVPVTPRNHGDFHPMGLLYAAVLGLTDPQYASTTMQWIPNMDGFPNGRRLEDDVTRIELQAVGGVVLAAIGLWYDDYTAGGANPVTPQLSGVLAYATGVNNNDTTFKSGFPFVQTPWGGYENHSGQ